MNLKIIIADDHAVVRRGLKQILTDEFSDADISEVGTANELLKIIRHEKFDLVISDISMPGITGIDLVKQIREEFSMLPVLILSMHPEEQYALRALKAGANGYLTKDSASEELVKAVNQILNGKKYISQSLAELLAENVSVQNISSPHEALSDREFEVLKLIASGKSSSEISEMLSLSVNTVSTYRTRIMGKMNFRTNAEIVRYAIEQKLI